MEPLSGRYLEVLDVLEEYLLLRELLRKMDDAYWCREREWREFKEPFYLVIDFAEIRTRAGYIEVSWNQIEAANRAVKAAAEKYADAFNNAALHRRDLRRVLRKLGLPDPADIRREAAYRPEMEPWWRRVFSNYEPPSRWLIKQQRPQSHEVTFHCLNDPDPSAAIAFWRTSQSSARTGKHPLIRSFTTPSTPSTN